MRRTGGPGGDDRAHSLTEPLPQEPWIGIGSLESGSGVRIGDNRANQGRVRMARGRPKRAEAKTSVEQRGNGATTGYEAELWGIADALRSSMDAAEYKHVVLGLIFLKYISEASSGRTSAGSSCDRRARTRSTSRSRWSLRRKRSRSAGSRSGSSSGTGSTGMGTKHGAHEAVWVNSRMEHASSAASR